MGKTKSKTKAKSVPVAKKSKKKSVAKSIAGQTTDGIPTWILIIGAVAIGWVGYTKLVKPIMIENKMLKMKASNLRLSASASNGRKQANGIRWQQNEKRTAPLPPKMGVGVAYS